MFIGHYALALGTKRYAPRTSLGALIAACQLPDLLWPVFLLLGWERIAPGDHGLTALAFVHYPWSHSLLMVVVWAIVAALVYDAFRRRDRRGAVLVALLVVSHWLLDVVTHRPDLLLYPGASTRFGLGLWTHPAAAVVIEGLMWFGGIAIYARQTRPVDRTGAYALWVFVVVLTLLYAVSLNAKPPADLRVIAWSALAGILVPVWAAWMDRHRRAGPGPRGVTAAMERDWQVAIADPARHRPVPDTPPSA